MYQARHAEPQRMARMVTQIHRKIIGLVTIKWERAACVHTKHILMPGYQKLRLPYQLLRVASASKIPVAARRLCSNGGS